MRVDPHSYFDPTQGTVIGANFEFKVDFESKVIEGIVTLFLSDHDHEFIDLDTRDLDIKSIRNHRGSLDYELSEKETILGSKLRVYLPSTEKYLTIEYKTSSESTALQWLEPEQTFGKVKPFLYSQCQALHARSLVPIQDSPGVRFTYSAVVDVRGDLKALMSANLNSSTKNNAQRNVHYFEMDQPVPAYLLALAVGNIGSKEISNRCRVYSEPEIVEQAAWEFADMENMLKATESILGPYLWDRYDVLVLPPAFPYGGMENPRLTFLSPAVVCGDRSKLNTLNHEAAHSWSGNLVTNKTWEDFWLNEGLTTYVERRLVEAMEGREVALLHWALGGVDLRDAFEDFKDQPNLQCLKTNLAGIDPDVAFSSVPYEKGSLFFLLLENIVGRTRFDRFLKKYIQEYKFKSISTEEFAKFLESEIPGISQEIRINQWLYSPGIPANAPKIHSEKLSALTNWAERFTDEVSVMPVFGAMKWSPQEWMIYLSKLSSLSCEDCQWLDTTFHLSQKKNQDLLVTWFSRALVSGYDEVLPSVRSLLESNGRMYALKELYKSLCKAGKKDLAKQWYEELKHLYHSAARAFVEPIFD